MSDCIHLTINGFNEQLNKIKQLQVEFPEQEITIGLTTFNHAIYHHFFQQPASAVRKLTEENYVPTGSTALLDAVGQSIREIEKIIQEQSHYADITVVAVIITDGYENASNIYRLDDIRRMIGRLEETGKWTFSFIGATLDAAEVAAQMAIKKDNSFSFDKSEMKSKVWDTLSMSMNSYMDKKRNKKDLGNFFDK
jgi:hypothetical protein